MRGKHSTAVDLYNIDKHIFQIKILIKIKIILKIGYHQRNSRFFICTNSNPRNNKQEYTQHEHSDIKQCRQKQLHRAYRHAGHIILFSVILVF